MADKALARKRAAKDDTVEVGGKFDREILTRVVELALPALATKGVLANELGQFWFTGTHMVAYSGDFGIRVVLDTGIKLGVDGTVFAGLVRSSKIGDVNLQVADDGDLLVKFGRSRSMLATRSLDRLYWSFPARYDDALSLPITEEFLSGLDRVLKLKQKGTTDQLEHRGVSLFPSKGGVGLYTTDSSTMIEVRVALEVPRDLGVVMLPRVFAEQIAARCSPGDRLYFPDKCLVATADGVEFFHALIDASGLQDMPKLVRTSAQKAASRSDFVPLPDGLDEALARASVVANGEEPFITFMVEEADPSLLLMTGAYKLGDLSERLKLGRPMNAPVAIKLNARELVPALSEADSFAFGEKSAVLTGGDDWTYLASVAG